MLICAKDMRRYCVAAIYTSKDRNKNARKIDHSIQTATTRLFLGGATAHNQFSVRRSLVVSASMTVIHEALRADAAD
jgi:hypothetical protein